MILSHYPHAYNDKISIRQLLDIITSDHKSSKTENRVIYISCSFTIDVRLFLEIKGETYNVPVRRGNFKVGIQKPFFFDEIVLKSFKLNRKPPP